MLGRRFGQVSGTARARVRRCARLPPATHPDAGAAGACWGRVAPGHAQAEVVADLLPGGVRVHRRRPVDRARARARRRQLRRRARHHSRHPRARPRRPGRRAAQQARRVRRRHAPAVPRAGATGDQRIDLFGQESGHAYGTSRRTVTSCVARPCAGTACRTRPRPRSTSSCATGACAARTRSRWACRAVRECAEAWCRRERRVRAGRRRAGRAVPAARRDAAGAGPRRPVQRREGAGARHRRRPRGARHRREPDVRAGLRARDRRVPGRRRRGGARGRGARAHDEIQALLDPAVQQSARCSARTLRARGWRPVCSSPCLLVATPEGAGRGRVHGQIPSVGAYGAGSARAGRCRQTSGPAAGLVCW